MVILTLERVLLQSKPNNLLLVLSLSFTTTFRFMFLIDILISVFYMRMLYKKINQIIEKIKNPANTVRYR